MVVEGHEGLVVYIAINDISTQEVELQFLLGMEKSENLSLNGAEISP